MRDDHSERDKAVADILRGLTTADAGAAWVAFLERYAPLIMTTAGQFVHEQDRVNECFLYVCEQLNDHGFRRLLKFDTTGKARFRTWLGAVAFNLCVDWHRREYGRATLLPVIAALPAFDQSVYRLVIEQGTDKETTFQTLLADFPDLTRELVANAVGRVFSLLSSRQRWQISVRNRGRKGVWQETFQGQVDRLPETGSGPAMQAQMQQQLDFLERAISRLPPDQRLLLRLRFQEGLSLEKIAGLQKLGDANRAWRHLQDAVTALRGYLRQHDSAAPRKN
jgi:RNA polymerase sigma factor (sigma-70 family)